MEFVTDKFSFLISLIIISFIAYVAINSILRNPATSLILVLVKFGFFCFYFLFWSQYRPVVLSDDQVYYQESLAVFRQGNNSILFPFSEEGILSFVQAAHGSHIGYYIYNYLSFILFGPYYYAPVILNVLFSTFAACVLYKTLRKAKVSTSFSYFFFIFYLLHWDMISWSTFINMKDILVQFLMLSSIFIMVSFKQDGFKLYQFVLLLLILFLLFFIRFYFCYFILVTAVVFFSVTQLNKIRSNITDLMLKALVMLVMPLAFYAIFITLYSSRIDSIGPRSNVLIGFFRYLVTPFPLKIESAYSFIAISSTLHWLFLLTLPIGLYYFIKNHFYNLMPFIILFLLLSIFYGSFVELQGPRHRIPQIAIIALLQAIGGNAILSALRNNRFRSLMNETSKDI